MPAFAINHMTVASTGFRQLLELAQRLGCVGVECRNDLTTPLFDGYTPQQASAMLRDAGLRLLSLAEITRFDRLTTTGISEALSLLDIAAEAGSKAVSLIPANDGASFDKTAMADALELLQPHLQQRNLIGMLEPLGFETCGLRLKALAVDLLEERNCSATYKIIHDTFHHHIAGETDFYPSHTGLVHLSGVVDPEVEVSSMRDSHRELVTVDDRLKNVPQILKLLGSGYSGPFSFEAFAPSVHSDPSVFDRIRRSINHIDAVLSQEAA